MEQDVSLKNTWSVTQQKEKTDPVEESEMEHSGAALFAALPDIVSHYGS